MFGVISDLERVYGWKSVGDDAKSSFYAITVPCFSSALAFVPCAGNGQRMKPEPAVTKETEIDDGARQGAPQATITPVDEDEDIFGDAGVDYVPTRRGECQEEKEASHQNYFDVGFATTSEKGTQAGPAGAQVLGVDLETIEQDQEKMKMQYEAEEKKKRLAKLQQDDDGYAECYPSYYNAAGIMDDSDEEEGSLPDGTDAKKGMIKEAAKDKAKLDHELTQIQKVLAEKGYEHSSAFGSTKSAKHKQSHDSDPIVASKKKRRI